MQVRARVRTEQLLQYRRRLLSFLMAVIGGLRWFTVAVHDFWPVFRSSLLRRLSEFLILALPMFQCVLVCLSFINALVAKLNAVRTQSAVGWQHEDLLLAERHTFDGLNNCFAQVPVPHPVKLDVAEVSADEL